MDRVNIAVRQGPAPDKETSALTEARCMGCGSWFLKREHSCPTCGKLLPAFNKGVRRAQLDRHMWEQARNA